MTDIRIEPGKRYYCELIDHPDRLGGTFAIQGGDIRLSLVSLHAFFHIDDERNLRVRTEDNWIASMFETLGDGWSERPGEVTTAYQQNVTSNTTLVGWDAWTDEDRVMRVRFRIAGADALFENTPMYDSVMNATMGSVPSDMLAAVTAEEEVTARLALSGGLRSPRPKTATPWFRIAFTEGRTLPQMRQAVTRVVRYVSCVAGVGLEATEVSVSRCAHDESLRRRELREPVHEHLVHYYHGADDHRSRSASPRSTLASLRDPTGRESFEAGLRTWIERDENWSAATAMMMATLDTQNVMSASRLLDATRWIEDMPGAEAQGVIDKQHAKALGKLVGKEAARLGYGNVGGRYRNAISMISSENHRDRFVRLLGDVRSVFGSDIVGDDIVDWLVEAMRMRGPAAHGARSAIDHDQEAFSAAVLALECMDALLTLKDLPIGAEAIRNAQRHLLVQGYRQQCMGRTPADVRSQAT